ncbi:MAG TPA: CD225/dispanin family protein [Streptosporangiaceae bacterium]|nr:CD225/dispanin family protein [Streptosporangiaceae bacterium]
MSDSSAPGDAGPPGPSAQPGPSGPSAQPGPHTGGYGVPPQGGPGQAAPPQAAPPQGAPPQGAPPQGGPGQRVGYGAPAGSYGPPPPTYLRWGIAAIVGGVLFSLIGGVPAGLVSTHFARQVVPKWQAGDQQGARSASRKARTWAIVATVLDVVGFIYVVYLFSNSATGTVG